MPLSSETNNPPTLGPTYLPCSFAQLGPLPQGLCTATDSATGSQATLAIKDLPANVADIRDAGWIPGSGRSPGNDNPLQYSCLENPMDRGAWWATVHRFSQSWIQLNDLAHTPVGYLTNQTCHSLSPMLLPWPKVDQVWWTTQTLPSVWPASAPAPQNSHSTQQRGWLSNKLNRITSQACS